MGMEEAGGGGGGGEVVAVTPEFGNPPHDLLESFPLHVVSSSFLFYFFFIYLFLVSIHLGFRDRARSRMCWRGIKISEAQCEGM